MGPCCVRHEGRVGLLLHCGTSRSPLTSSRSPEDAEGGAGRGRGRRSTYMSAMVDGNRRANDKKNKGDSAAPASALRKQSYSLFLKQRAVLFSAKKWK
ncbi:unnamed protein product [Parnassius apollo]|uniref:(apollo) hypothetical protein n=1 Tax=Parnassius apollo TaxID=110799 RepID=A0A8S3Y8Q7_PARAO|nr:unnamed protein product [Parnassius apollo]